MTLSNNIHMYVCYVGVVGSRSVGNMYEMHKEETHLHFDDYYEDGALH